jgi:hypothetical protein
MLKKKNSNLQHLQKSNSPSGSRRNQQHIKKTLVNSGLVDKPFLLIKTILCKKKTKQNKKQHEPKFSSPAGSHLCNSLWVGSWRTSKHFCIYMTSCYQQTLITKRGTAKGAGRMEGKRRIHI